MFKIYREKAGVISKEPVWVIIDSGWLYISKSFLRLLWIYITEYKHNRHLVG